ncbi:hypothetical protein JTB14_003713 [Gonioctena quinquepunctata]|nr:hypothetical protein JTB14_003713 [Gonioctena quinquepunctata]
MSMSNVKAVRLTTDCWSSSTTENFLAVTAHFLSDDFVMKHKVLGCESFGEIHTGENLGDAINKFIDEWGLEDTILMVVSDNASNIKKAVEEDQGLQHKLLDILERRCVEFQAYADDLVNLARTSGAVASDIL